MRHWFLVAVWLSVATPVEAQRPISFGVAGGASLPEGDVHDLVSAGWHALATAALSSPMQPLGLRLDVAYNRFAFSDQAQTLLGGEGHLTTGSATLNITYRLPRATWPVSPYVLVGAGAYRTECSLGPGCRSRVRYGWNFGLGAKLFFLGLPSFVEVRHHRTKSRAGEVHYFPLTFGIMF